MRETSFDIAVIGGGPGGYVAAIRAAQLGLKPVVIEREQLGGICLNWGCIPTKALLRTAELYHLMGRASEFGLAADNLRYDLARIVERSRKAAARLSDGVAYLMQKNKITVVDGTARLQGQGRIAVTDRDGQPLPEIEAKHIIVATGARARGRARRRASSPTARWFGPTRKPWFRGAFRNLCSSWAQAPSASSSRASTGHSAPR
jgi:dihydrolipoamide dehydrogenase